MEHVRKIYTFANEMDPMCGYFMIENSPIMFDINGIHTLAEIFIMDNSNLGPMNGCEDCLDQGFCRGVFAFCCDDCAIQLFGNDVAKKKAFLLGRRRATQENLKKQNRGYLDFRNRTLRFHVQPRCNKHNIAVHLRFEDSPNYDVESDSSVGLKYTFSKKLFKPNIKMYNISRCISQNIHAPINT